MWVYLRTTMLYPTVSVGESESCSVVSNPLRPHGLQACQVSLSMEFSRQEYWSGWLFPSPEDLPNPGIEPRSTTLQVDSFLSSHQGSRVWILKTKITPFRLSENDLVLFLSPLTWISFPGVSCPDKWFDCSLQEFPQRPKTHQLFMKNVHCLNSMVLWIPCFKFTRCCFHQSWAGYILCDPCYCCSIP